MASSRLSAIEKAALWFTIVLGLVLLLASRSGSVVPLVGMALLSTASMVLILARKRATTGERRSSSAHERVTQARPGPPSPRLSSSRNTSSTNGQSTPMVDLVLRLVFAVFLTFGVLLPISKFMTDGELPFGPKYFRVWCYYPNDGASKAWYFKDKDKAEMKDLEVESKGHASCQVFQRDDGQPYQERTNEYSSQ